MSLRCSLGFHDEAIRDQMADGTRCLRCPRCWAVCGYPETDPGKVEALRAEQQRQAAQIAVKRQWVEAGRLLPWPGRRRVER